MDWFRGCFAKAVDSLRNDQRSPSTLRDQMTEHFAKTMLLTRLTRHCRYWVAIAGCMTIGCDQSPEPITDVPVHEEPRKTQVDVDRHAPHDASRQQKAALPIEAKQNQSQHVTHGNETEVQSTSETNRYRIPDDRPDVNSVRLAANGIREYESRHLLLLTDLPEEQVAALPAHVDALFAELEAHFGPLPHAADGAPFQVTGHLIGETARFEAAELMPPADFSFDHGMHLNYRFWLHDQSDDYYRRHLLFHEFVHCFMTCEVGMSDLPPLWYFEGLAELFATHRLRKGKLEFGVMPDTFHGFEGWGRISEIRRRCELRSAGTDSGIPSMTDVTPQTVTSFADEVGYPFAWAFAWFIHNHPKHCDAFVPLRKERRFASIHQLFQQATREEFHQISTDWMLFVDVLIEGFDPDRSFAVRENNSQSPDAFDISADQGWQHCGVSAAGGQNIVVQGEGRVTLANLPKPWASEPQGVSIQYHRGVPLGKLIGIWVSHDGRRISRRQSIGRHAELTAPFDGELWLQINDSAASRADNDGQYRISVSGLP